LTTSARRAAMDSVDFAALDFLVGAIANVGCRCRRGLAVIYFKQCEGAYVISSCTVKFPPCLEFQQKVSIAQNVNARTNSRITCSPCFLPFSPPSTFGIYGNSSELSDPRSSYDLWGTFRFLLASLRFDMAASPQSHKLRL
jgi:hypothetical protein